MTTMREIIGTVGETSLEGRALYEADELVWIERQIEALQAGDISRLDRPTLIEFLTEMTISQKRELQSRLTILLLHLLKTKYQPERLTMSWVDKILEQQRQVRSLLKLVPSLRPQADAFLATAYPDAVVGAAKQTGIAAASFPSESLWTVAEALAFDPPPPPPPLRKRRRK